MKLTVPHNARQKPAFADTRPDNRAGFHPREDPARRRLGGGRGGLRAAHRSHLTPPHHWTDSRAPGAPHPEPDDLYGRRTGASRPRRSFHLLHWWGDEGSHFLSCSSASRDAMTRLNLAMALQARAERHHPDARTGSNPGVAFSFRSSTSTSRSSYVPREPA